MAPSTTARTTRALNTVITTVTELDRLAGVLVEIRLKSTDGVIDFGQIDYPTDGYGTLDAGTVTSLLDKVEAFRTDQGTLIRTVIG
jgi:hypothetical protein